MSQVTTLGIGGPAKDFKIVKTEKELIQIHQPYLLIGEGSNLLVSDKGVNQLVIKNEIIGIEHQGLTVKVKSGTALQDLVDYSIKHGLSGLQKLTGIPGTIGGAIFGNAGAYGQTLSNHLIKVSAFDPDSIGVDGQNIISLTKNQCNFNYRDSSFKKNGFIILEATFLLEEDDPQTLDAEAKAILAKRLVKYPKGIKCPGSFFKNIVAGTLPKEILANIPAEMIVYGKLPAGSLLETVGAKGDSEDGIKIADYHANLFVNKGSGTAKAFYDLAKKYALKVQEKFGITLEPEVQLINLPSI